jgi:hypothetical protein
MTSRRREMDTLSGVCSSGRVSRSISSRSPQSSRPSGAHESWSVHRYRLYDHAFVKSQGDLPSEFARAGERRNYLVAVGLAAQLKPLSLVEALGLLPLIAPHEPVKYDAVAVRWLTRWQLERRGVDPAASGLP